MFIPTLTMLMTYATFALIMKEELNGKYAHLGCERTT